MRTFGLGLQLGFGNVVMRASSGGGNGNFVTVVTGSVGSSTGKLMLSTDSGATWDSGTAYSTPAVTGIDALVSAGDRLYLRYSGGTNRVYTSTDGVAWTVCTGVETGVLANACKVGSKYVLSFNNSLRISDDGVNFVNETTQVGSNYGCASIGDTCIVSSTISNYKLSTNGGVTWSTPVAGISAAFASSHPNGFVLIASSLCRRSATGLSGSWSSSTVTGLGTCAGVTSNGVDTFVTIGTTGKISYSIDNGATWVASADIGEAGFTTGLANGSGAIFYAGGSWLATMYTATSGVAKIYKADSPAGPFALAYSWVNGTDLAGIQVIPT